MFSFFLLLCSFILHFFFSLPWTYLLEHFFSGGNIVLLYASKYHDIDTVVNVSGRYFLHRGIDERFTANFMESIKKNGFADFENKGETRFASY